MASHNQYQYQEALKEQKMKLEACSCGPFSFPLVEYYPAKGVRITCRFCSNKVIVKPAKANDTDREIVRQSAIKWNKKDYDR